MKRKILALLCMAIGSLPLCANGGIHWGENGSGTHPAVITLKNYSDIILKKENLALRFVDDAVIVSCDYVLFNKHESEKQIDFAFNITEGSHASLDYYNIFVEGRKLDSDFNTEISFDEIFTLYKYWELSKIKLAAKKETSVSICYRVKTENDGTYYKCNFDKGNSFLYNLYPALSFGNGIIEDFTLTIDASDILGWNGKVTDIEGVDISFSGSERCIAKSFKNFDLNKHKQLKISYNIKNYYFAKLYEKYGRRESVTATSELREGSTLYSAYNLTDKDCKTAWVESKPDFGKNEKIKIDCNGWITQLLIVNGFRKSEKTYYENNRVKKIALYIDGIKIGQMTFPDRPYRQVNMSNILDEGDLLNLNGEFFKKDNERVWGWGNTGTFFPKENIEIEILEVYPGTKYNDTCISDIYLIKAVLPLP